jgi:hypothetical protein
MSEQTIPKDYKCENCKLEISIVDVGFLGDKKDYDALNKTDSTDYIENSFECSPHMEMKCVCRWCFKGNIGTL